MLFCFSASLIQPSSADAAFTLKQKFGDKEVKLEICGYLQLEVVGGEGVAKMKDKSDDGLRFRAQSIRLGTNYSYGNMFGKLHLGFNQAHDKSKAGLPLMIKDAFVGYRFCDSAFIRLGMIKTPIGMDYTTAGWNLDIVERNKLEKGLVLERDMGVLLSGRFIGFDQDGKTSGTEMGHEKPGKGIGYDIGVFNSAGRSASVKDQASLAADKRTIGKALAYAARIHFDWGEPLHFEASYGFSERAGGKGTEDFQVFDAGINSFFGPLNLKAEYICGKNIQGVKNADQSTVVGTVAYMLPTIPKSRFELVVKHYQSFADPANSRETSLGNTYLGVSFFYIPDEKLATSKLTRKVRRKMQSHRIQANAVITSYDDGDDWTGMWGYTEEAFLLQWQFRY